MANEGESLFLHVDLGEAGELSFSTLKEFKEWFASEKAFYSKIAGGNDNNAQRAKNHLQQRWQKIQQQLTNLENEILQKNRKPNESAPLAQPVQQAFKQGNRTLHPSDSAQAKFLQALNKERPNDASAALCIILDQPPNANEPSSFTGAAALALFEAETSRSAQNHRESLNEVYRDGRKQIASLKGQHTRLTRVTSDLEETGNSAIADQDSAHQDLLADHKQKLDERFIQATETLSAHEETYREEIALHATIDYWAEEKKQRTNESQWVAGCFSVSLVAAAGMLWWFATQLFAAEITPQKIGAIFLAAAPIFWGLRVLARLLLSYLHLASDAGHRQLLIKTYLALHNEGKVRDEDRELLLGSIFRPASTGIVRDDAAPSWSDFVSNLDGKGTH